MAKQSLEEKLARLKRIEEGLCPDDAVREIRQALSGANNILSARAAQSAAILKLRDLGQELIAVFDRCMQNPAKTDPGCRAKLAAIEALNALDYPGADIFLRGIRHVQMEWSFGQPVDTADNLRAACAFGLYRLGHPELLFELVTLLTDVQPAARRAAIKILTEPGHEWSELLLRMKVLQGDREVVVLGDCFSGLMAIAPLHSLRFVAQFILSEDAGIAEEAALAIGNSRLPEAFALLCDYRNDSVAPAFKRMLLLPIALTRCDEAFNLLISVVKEEHPDNAEAAVQALSIYGNNPERHGQIREAVFARNDPSISAAYEKEMAGR